MSGIIRVNNIKNEDDSVNLSTSFFQRRLVQRYTRWFFGGVWNPGNSYFEIPGSYINVTPLYDNSLLVYSTSAPIGHVGGWNRHCISHWVFTVNGTEYARHNRSMDHIENGNILRWEVPSWGKGVASSMGYIARQYNSGNHGVHFNGRRYLNGTSVNAPVPVYVSVEEYVEAS